ncbi:MAG: glycosyltransferase family 39 protein, partial [Candidatus Methylomirabilis sp.]|nr:glycosyltransferase family 39 protein [Deltaproteobacteria bacterium]
MQTPPRKALADSLLVLLLSVLLYTPGIGARDFWEADEPRYPEVARQMIVEGRWLIPYLNGDIYMEKPPIYFWAMRIPYAIQGDLTEVGARSVIVGFAAVALAATYLLGALMVGRTAGWVAALATATTFEVSEFSQTAVMDVPMLAFITPALLAYALWTRFDWRPRTMQAAAYACMGLGVLTKGPLAVLLPGLLMATDGLLRHGKAAFRAKHLRWGPLVTLGTLMLWLGPATLLEGKQFFSFMVEHHIVNRATSARAPHARPFYS